MSENVAVEMPQYQCHKKVWALKIKEIVAQDTGDDEWDGSYVASWEDDGYGPMRLSAAFCEKHSPVAGGYIVVYEDGYQSFSPAQAFESGYSRI